MFAASDLPSLSSSVFTEVFRVAANSLVLMLIVVGAAPPICAEVPNPPSTPDNARHEIKVDKEPLFKPDLKKTEDNVLSATPKRFGPENWGRAQSVGLTIGSLGVLMLGSSSVGLYNARDVLATSASPADAKEKALAEGPIWLGVLVGGVVATAVGTWIFFQDNTSENQNTLQTNNGSSTISRSASTSTGFRPVHTLGGFE